MSYNNITVSTENFITTITLNRPPTNSVNLGVREELNQAITELEQSKDTRVVIITGAGDKGFSAGMDVSDIANINKGPNGNDIMNRIERSSKPFIAAINGYALGGGCELAMSCDMRLASAKAKFGQPEVGLGITPGYSGTQRLPRLVGKAKAMELILTGDIITADDAAAIGLVNKVTEPEALMDEAYALAARIIKNAPLAVQYSKKAIRDGIECTDMDKAIDIEAELFAKCFATEDQKEGMGAFLEKRKPVFKGK